MASITIAAGSFPLWEGAPTTLELRYYSNGFWTSDGLVIIGGSPYDLALLPNFFKKVTLTPAGGSLTYTSHTIYSTEDSIDKPVTGRWTLAIFDSTTKRAVAIVSGLESFKMPATPSSTDLDNLRVYNLGGVETVANRDVLVTGNLAANGNLIVLGTISGGDAVGDTVTFAGPVAAQSFSGNGAGLTGVVAGTGGVTNTGSTTIGADTDSDGVGIVDIQTRGITRFRARNAGQSEFFSPFITPGYTLAGLPAVGIVGQVARITDDTKGLWMDNGTQWVSLFGRIFDVRMCGAKGDGTTDDTTVIQNAITACQNAGGGIVFFPIGIYKVTGLTISANSVTLMGANVEGSRIAMNSATGDTLAFSAAARRDSCQIRHLNFTPLVTRTSGSEINAPWTGRLTIFDVQFVECFRGMMIGAAAQVTIHPDVSKISFSNTTNLLTVVRTIDGQFSYFSGGTNVLAADTIYLDGGNESCTLDHISVVNTGTPTSVTGNALHIKKNIYATTPTRYCNFSNNYWDSHLRGVYNEDGTHLVFVNEWFSAKGAGFVITGGTEISVANSTAVNCGDQGFYFGTDGVVNASGITASANNRNANAVGNIGSAGIAIAMASPGTVNLTGSRSGNEAVTFPPNNQSYGVWITSGSVNFNVSNNNFLLNGTGGINNLAGTSGTIRIVGSNLL